MAGLRPAWHCAILAVNFFPRESVGREVESRRSGKSKMLVEWKSDLTQSGHDAAEPRRRVAHGALARYFRAASTEVLVGAYSLPPSDRAPRELSRRGIKKHVNKEDSSL